MGSTSIWGTPSRSSSPTPPSRVRGDAWTTWGASTSWRTRSTGRSAGGAWPSSENIRTCFSTEKVSICPIHTANEGPVRIQYKCLGPFNVFPEMKLLFPKQNNNVLSQFLHSYICERFIYIFPGPFCLFCCREICGLILGIYKSLTDTWMWKLGLRPRNSQKRNT